MAMDLGRISFSRNTLDLDHCTRVVSCDARQRDSVKRVLVTLVKHAHAQIDVGSALFS
jgi:hypothetical protein